MYQIEEVETVAVTTDIATTGAIDFRRCKVGQMHITATGSPTSLTWYTSHDGTTYQPAYDASGAIVQTIAKLRSYQIPVGLIGANYLKAVGDADCTLGVSLKG